MHSNYLSPLTEKDFFSSTVYSLDSLLCPERGSCLINSLLAFVPEIVAISLFCPHFPLCQQVCSGGLGFLTVLGCWVIHRAAWSSYSCEILWFSSKPWAGLYELHGALPASSWAGSEASSQAWLCPWVHTEVQRDSEACGCHLQHWCCSWAVITESQAGSGWKRS